MSQQKTLVASLKGRWKQREIMDLLRCRIDRLNAQSTRTTPTYKDASGGSAGDQDSKMSSKAAAMDYEKKLEAMQSKWAAEGEALWEKVVEIDIPVNQSEVVRLRSIVGMSWPDISNDMGITERRCQQILTDAYRGIADASQQQHQDSVAISLSTRV